MLNKFADDYTSVGNEMSEAQAYSQLHTEVNELLETPEGYKRDEEFTKAFHSEVSKPFVQKLVQQIEKDLESSAEMSGFCVLDPRWEHFGDQAKSEEKVASLATYLGNAQTLTMDEVEYVATHPLVPAAGGITGELEGMLALIAARRWSTFGDVLDNVLKDPQIKVLYPATSRFLEVAATLPIGTAGVERMFSLMKLVKTRLRATMHDETLEDIMYTTLEIPFNYDTGMDNGDLEFVVDAFRNNSSVENVDADGRTRAARYCPFKTYMEAMLRVRAMRMRTYDSVQTQTINIDT